MLVFLPGAPGPWPAAQRGEGSRTPAPWQERDRALDSGGLRAEEGAFDSETPKPVAKSQELRKKRAGEPEVS